MTIKAIKYLLILMISLILTGCGNGKDDPLLRDINGHSFHFSDLRGKWVFINYWATWCGPCKKEIPQLNQFYESNKQKDVVVFGVNYDQVPSKEIKIMAKNLNIDYPTLALDPAKSLGLGDIPGIPVTFLFDPKGVLVKTLYGEQTTKSLEAVLSQTKSS